MKISKKACLVVVDVQNDFCPGGALPVPGGDKVVPVLKQYIKKFLKGGAPIFATRDFHPSNHCSFKPQGGLWPPHCIQSTKGAEFHPDLALPEEAVVISKATKPDEEAYSSFQGTGLAKLLREKGVDTVFVAGLATDYCVLSTALDALKAGFKAVFLEDASRGIDPKGTKEAVERMLKNGAKRATLSDL